MLKGTIISDIDKSNEINLLCKKRANLNSNITNEFYKNENKFNFNNQNDSLIKSNYVDFQEEIQLAFQHFLNGESEKFQQSYKILESNINSKTNNVLIEKEKANVNSEENLLKDKTLENNKKLENFENNENYDEYLNQVFKVKKRKLENNNVNNNLNQEHYNANLDLNNKIKEELGNLKKCNEFEKTIQSYQLKGKGDNLEEKRFSEQQRITKNQENKKLRVLSLCQQCMGGKLNEDTVISKSQSVYLGYPFSSGSITDFHFLIVPKEHINSLAATEENVYEEIRNYMKSIVAFNLKNELATIFIEFSHKSSDLKHFEIECIPIKFCLIGDARIYFKKALMDQDTEWTTNKNIVDTTVCKGNLTKIINEKFSYVHVDFMGKGGFLHPIEDSRRFSTTFLREIFSPLIDKSVFEIKFPQKIGFKEMIEKVEYYKRNFSYYDWTKYYN